SSRPARLCWTGHRLRICDDPVVLAYGASADQALALRRTPRLLRPAAVMVCLRIGGICPRMALPPCSPVCQLDGVGTSGSLSHHGSRALSDRRTGIRAL